MAGSVFPLFSKRYFDFTAGDSEVIVVQAMDAADYTEATLLLRVHGVSLSVAGSKIQLIADDIAPAFDDPSVDFVKEELAIAEINNTGTAPTAPKLRTAALNNFGEALRFRVVGTLSGGGGTCNATLSADVVLKE